MTRYFHISNDITPGGFEPLTTPENSATENGLYLLDSHAHVDDSDFDTDREEVIARARGVGVKLLMIAGGGIGPERLGSPLPIAEKYNWMFATVGLHPHEARHFTPALADQLRQLAAHPKVLALGEIGLDYYYDHSPREAQRAAFVAQCELARELKLPIVIHCRDGFDDLRELVDAHWKSSGLGGILHCFTGNREQALHFAYLGFLISFSGIITFPKAEGIREAARVLPADRLLTETDCPYLAPVPHRGKRNEPAFVAEVNRQLARLRGLTEHEMGAVVLSNFRAFFQISA
jgi:TatD DNase family protein